MRTRLEQIMADHTGRTVEEIHRDTERDKIFTADEAVAYGLADRVMKRRQGGGE